MKSKFFVLLFFLGPVILTHAQVLLKKEKLKANIYKLEFENHIQYKVYKEGTKNIVSFPYFKEPSKSGQFVLPEKDLFIPIPANTKPSAELTVLKQEKINAVPEVNPEAVLVNDSTIGYVKSKFTGFKNKPGFTNKGYLWIGNKYYVHLKIRLFDFSPSGFVVQKKSFRITLKFKTSIKAETVNKKYGLENTLINSKYNFASSTRLKKFPVNYNDNWIDYSNTYLKLGVGEDAIYRIDKNDLAAYGINVSTINPKTFKLFLKGNEIPIYVAGENDGSFDKSDYIEFAGIKNYGDKDYRQPANYGEPYNEFMDRYSDTSSYFLTWDGTSGKRIDTLLHNVGTTTDTLDYYDEFLHFETNMWYDFSLSGGEVRRQNPNIYENETWEWWVQGVSTRNFSFNVSDLKPGLPAKAYLKIQSWASNISTNAHNLALKINSNPTPVDSSFINKYQVITLQGEFDSGNLTDGNNKLKLISYPTQANPNSCFGDWWEIEYPRLIKVNNDSLLFGYRNLTSKQFAAVKVSGLSGNDFSLYKLIDNKPAAKITNYVFNGNTLIFNDTISNGNTYIITAVNKIAKPKFYYKKKFVNLRNSANQAGYVLITHPDFLSTAADYAKFVENNYNVKTKVVNVFDIYDEFNYGFLAPEPIKDFLMMTQDNWQAPHPKYVFLVGKPTYDFHGYKTKYFGAPPQKNYVPSYGEPVSDIWYVIWDSTGSAIPQIDIGRLPCQSNEEFRLYLQKHQNYLSQKYDAWNKRFLFLSGGTLNDPFQLSQLKGVNDYIINNYVVPPPIGGIWHHFYKTANPVTNFGPFSQDVITNAIDQGGLFISYLGHSGTQTWDNSISQSNQLENKINKNPMITDFGCSTGKYAEPDVTSFSEQFTVQQGGQALTYVGNSSLGFVSTATTYPQLFYKKFLKDSVLNIADAHRLAKIELLNTYGSSSVNELFSMTNELIGDPVIKLRLPEKPNFVIDNSSVEFDPRLPSDTDDSVNVKIKYFNYGLVPAGDSVAINIEDIFNGKKTTGINLIRPVPDFIDSVEIKLPTKNYAGLHHLTIKLDPMNKIDEIYENDNSADISFNVLSGSIKFLAPYNVENELIDTLKIINPTKKPQDNSFTLELDNTPDFTNPTTETLSLNSLFSKYHIPAEYKNKRIWVRAKLSGSSEFGLTKSFFIGSKTGYLINDSLSFNRTNRKNVLTGKNSINLDSNNVEFKVTSAGFNDGNTAFVFKNGQNFIPENTLRGHHVVVFEDSTYMFKEAKLFDLLGGGSAVATEYLNFLDTLSSKYLVCFAVKDEGKIGLSNDLKNKIKEFGSIYIDSLAFRGSWAFIGKKGAAPGSMPEAFSKPFDGRVTIDTVITGIHESGSILTAKIGPASHWKKLSVSDSLPSDSKINYRILGVKSDTELDTLNYVTINNSEADLSFLNDLNYSYIKVLAEFNASSDLISPSLKSLGVSYTGVPELGTNYQVVSVDKDTVDQGEDINLSFYVYNAGESAADSFKVSVNLIKPNNSTQQLFEELVNSIGPEQRKLFTVNFKTTSYSGNGQFNINIDTENKITELYKDNNFYSLPFFVKGDTTKPALNITFDGNDIFDGEYVSTNPDIKIELNDPSLIPINDTSAVTLFLNDRRIYYSKNPDVLSINFSNTNPKVTVNYRPKLEKGEYTLTVFGKDASGNVADSAGISKNFLVESETKLLNLYNYPNPFNSETYFTFKLTQIPDEIKIKIYTIAGRLIKEIDVPHERLNFDFNRIYWDGRDSDGDTIANGVYIYKVLMKSSNKTEQFTQKLAIIR